MKNKKQKHKNIQEKEQELENKAINLNEKIVESNKTFYIAIAIATVGVIGLFLLLHFTGAI